MDAIISIPDKAELCNHGSKLVLVQVGPGLRDIHLATNRLKRGRKPQAHLVLLKADGQTVKAKRTNLLWRPWMIESEFAFPDGPEGTRVVQRSWVDWPFVHAAVRIEGDLGGAKLAAEGESYDRAKALVSRQRSVIVEEMDPGHKPFALEIAASISPDRAMLSADGKTWTETDFAWSEDVVHYRMIWDRAPREMVVSAHLGKTSDFLPVEAWRRSRGREDHVRRKWMEFYAHGVPEVDCPDTRFRDLMQYCFYVHRSSVVEPGGMLAHPYVVPSKLTYPAWWSWDTAFHAIVDAWMRDPLIAHGDLLNHTMVQTRKGCIPDAGGESLFVTGQGRWLPPEIYDSFPPPSTGPCVNGLATWDVYRKTGDMHFLKLMYPHLVTYERWLVSEKASGLDPDLIAYKNWYDVGWDDSKRWGKTGMGDLKGEVDWDLPVVPVDGNVFFALLRETISRSAALLGDVELAREYAEKTERTRQAIESRMWNENERFYFDLLPDGKMVSAWTPAGFTPLLAGLPCHEKYLMLRQHLLNPSKFWAECPLPTLALDDPHFSTTNWWRGATWPVINWQVNEGLFRYDPETGLKLLIKTVEMMTAGGHPTCREYYGANDCAGGGAVDQSWAAMPVDLILRRVFGLKANPDGLEIRPHLSESWDEARVRNVTAAGTRIEAAYKRAAGELDAVVKNVGGKAIEVRAGTARVMIAPGKEAALAVGRQ